MGNPEQGGEKDPQQMLEEKVRGMSDEELTRFVKYNEEVGSRDKESTSTIPPPDWGVKTGHEALAGVKAEIERRKLANMK